MHDRNSLKHVTLYLTLIMILGMNVKTNMKRWNYISDNKIQK